MTMSIKVENIQKRYGDQLALNDVSFQVSSSEVVGFLGPNGAGKTTMMKILTGYIPPTAGKASVCDKDVMEESLEVRKKVGYLPENNPLYLDMYVKEYLGFVAGIYKLNNKTQRVKEMIDLVGLGLEQNKPIGALSKGYRQRVGLAQAMIHNPEVLILDEPTSGLDPNQLTEIRQLISDIGREKTVLLSTHIMQEVEALCQRVIIINRGKIVANDTVSVLLRQTGSRKILMVEFSQEVPVNKIKNIRGVERVEVMEGHTYRIHYSQQVDLRETLFRFAVDEKVSVLTMHQEEQKLEEIFKLLTHPVA